MALSDSWFQGIVLTGIATTVGVVTTLGVVGLGNQSSISTNVARLSEAVENIEKEQIKMTAEINKNRIEIKKLGTQFKANQLDVKSILVSAGIVEPGEVFASAVIDGRVWVFPGREMADRWIKSGRSFEQITPILSGIPIVEVEIIIPD